MAHFAPLRLISNRGAKSNVPPAMARHSPLKIPRGALMSAWPFCGHFMKPVVIFGAEITQPGRENLVTQQRPGSYTKNILSGLKLCIKIFVLVG